MCAEESFTIKPGMVNLDFMLTWTCGALGYKNPAKRSRLHLHCVFGLQPSNLFRVPVHSLPPDWLHFQPVPDPGHATCLSSSNPDHSNYSLQPARCPTMQWPVPHSPCNHECTTYLDKRTLFICNKTSRLERSFLRRSNPIGTNYKLYLNIRGGHRLIFLI